MEKLKLKKKTFKIFSKDFCYLQVRLFIPYIREFDEIQGQGSSDFKKIKTFP